MPLYALGSPGPSKLPKLLPRERDFLDLHLDFLDLNLDFLEQLLNFLDLRHDLQSWKIAVEFWVESKHSA